MPHIYIDADACPVRNEVYRVAERYELPVTLVANTWMRIPQSDRIALEVVGAGEDIADNWIAERAQKGDIVVTADILLADRCLKKGAAVLGTSGKPFTAAAIGSAVAMRNLMADLRGAGKVTGGPPPIDQRDRSRFLQELDKMIRAIRR